MNPWDGKTAAFMRTVTNILILNILWVICSMPLVTIGPSTAAMMAVIRKWHLYQDHSVFRSFISEYRTYLKQGFIVGTPWIIFGFLLVIDVVYFLQIPSGAKVIFIGITAMVFLLYIMTSAFLFPILVHYQSSGIDLIKQAFTFAFLDGKTSLAIVLMWVGAGMVLYYAPLMIFVIIVPVSMISFRFAMVSFGKKENLPKAQSTYNI
nr:DUF624 domain-containing protein [Neobacillus sp. Marseille-Q6967]